MGGILGEMIIKRVSLFSGNLNEREIDISEEEYLDIRRKMMEGVLIQDAAPNLSPDEREFIATGITTEEFDEFILYLSTISCDP